MRNEADDFSRHLSLDEAQLRVAQIAALRVLPAESAALENALGRILADDVHAPFDVPGYVNSAMDGYALRSADLAADGETTLTLIGAVLAGSESATAVVSGTCVRVTTGAPLPAGADTVVMKENTRADGDVIYVMPGTTLGENVRPAGEDYRTGDFALARGCVLTPARLGVLASFGAEQVQVTRRPRVVLLTTGDELAVPGATRGFGQVYDSNRHSLGALLAQHGAVLSLHERMRDDPPMLSAALLRAAAEADIVVTSGGVSAGEADFLPRLLAEVGKVHFWKVLIKPGMPVLCGEIGRTLVFGLPGNPVSGVATFLAMVRPALDALTGRAEPRVSLHARLASTVVKTHARTEFVRAELRSESDGVLRATPLKKQGSGMLRGVADANALIVLPGEAQTFAEGTVVEVLPLPGWA